MAKEKGLEPLALHLLEQERHGDLLTEAAAFVNEEKNFSPKV